MATIINDVRSFYSSVPKELRDTFGPRNVFDSAEFRYVLKDGGKLIAFIEAKVIAGSKLYYNIGFKDRKYCNGAIFNNLFENIDSSQYIMQEFCSTYGTDFALQELLKGSGFRQIADRHTILKYHLINDASHIHFVRG